MRFEIYPEKKAGMIPNALTPPQWRWRLWGSNGKIIADSGEGYNHRADCVHGVELVMGTNRATPVTGESGSSNSLAGLLSEFAATGFPMASVMAQGIGTTQTVNDGGLNKLSVMALGIKQPIR